MSALTNNLTQSPFVCPAALLSGTKIGISTPCGINYSYHCVTLVWGPIWNTYLPRVQHILTSYSNAFASFSLHLELTIELPRKARARRRAAMIASEILRKRSAHGACFTSTSVLYHLWLDPPLGNAAVQCARARLSRPLNYTYEYAAISLVLRPPRTSTEDPKYSREPRPQS